MYLFSGVLLVVLLVFFLFGLYKRRRIIRWVCSLPMEDKCCRLNALIEPMGFAYNLCQDVFTSLTDAWQQEFGYRALYDRNATAMNMVFDCEPVYFDYCGRTWLIEVWKGQYGINIGGEIGVYHADSLLTPDQYGRAVFHRASPEEMLPLCMTLSRERCVLFELNECHWWLTGFRMGQFAWPRELSLNVSITFPDCCMLQAFVDALLKLGYTPCDLSVCGMTVSFCLCRPRSPRRGCCLNFRRAFAQWRNRILCKLYLWATKPFTCNVDRLLYLYGFVPSIFRRTIRIRRFKKHYPYRRHTRRRR